jgi:cytochrome c peroxidase
MRHGWVQTGLLISLLSATTAQCQYPSHSQPNNSNASNPTRVDSGLTALGKRLFFDARLSADQKVSCSSCHDPAHGFSDARVLSAGVFGRHPKRHTPTIIGRGIRTREGEPLEFWDGRAASLEEQVLQPIANPDEMGMSIEEVLKRLNQDGKYRLLAPGGLTRESLAAALAGYVRTLRSEDNPLDRFFAARPAGAYGDRRTDNERQLLRDGLKDPGTNYYRPQNGRPQEGALQDGGFTALELEGFRLFQDKARCYLCHSGPQFTDESFHNTGIAWRDGALQDEGRSAIDGKPYHKGAFKTPTLRDVARRGPYMHDGSLASLEDVINYYDRGGNQNPYLDENIAPLHLSEAEKKALLAFLRNGLSGKVMEGRREGQ